MNRRHGWSYAGGRYVFRNAANEVRCFVNLHKGEWYGRFITGEGWGDTLGPYASASAAQGRMMREMAQRPPTAGEVQYMALKVAAPNRAAALSLFSDQADAAHLPLFVAANEPMMI